MLNMIAGSVLPITAFIGVFFAFAATCILTSFLNDWLPRDMGCLLYTSDAADEL